MEKNAKKNEFQTMEDLMHDKIDTIANHLNDGKIEYAMIELGVLNDYIRLQSRKAMALLPNNML